jgi:hypothetical protein
MSEKKKRRTIPDPPLVTLWRRDDGTEHACLVQWEYGGGVFCRGASEADAREKARQHIQAAKELAIGRVKASAARIEGRIKARMST